MRVVACQWDITWEDKAANHARVRHLLAAARPRRDSLVVLPEMFATGFSMNVAGITDSGSGETQRFLAATAESHGVYLLGGLVTGEADGEGRNEAVLYSPRGQEAGRYRKIHPYTLAAENEHFVGGDDVALWACNEFVLAPFVCYDLRFPEVFRTAAARGATLFCVIASWPAARSDHWHTLLRARAIENQAYVVGVNRCGDDPAGALRGRQCGLRPPGTGPRASRGRGRHDRRRARPDRAAALPARLSLAGRHALARSLIGARGGPRERRDALSRPRVPYAAHFPDFPYIQSGNPRYRPSRSGGSFISRGALSRNDVWIRRRPAHWDDSQATKGSGVPWHKVQRLKKNISC